MIGIEEAFGDFRSGVKEKDFILRAINYYYAVSDEGTHEARKLATGGFIVAKYFSPRSGGSSSYYEAIEQSERIMDEIIEKIISDSRAGHPLWGYSLNSRQQFNVQDVMFTGDGSYAGRRCVFQFSNFFRICVTSDDAPEWLDGGQTPFVFE